MNIIGKKRIDSSKNEFYGVDVNDKNAVVNEFNRLKKRHRNITILVIVVLCILGVILFDFWRVNFVGGKPIFAISSKVERGTLFSGLGYKVLYCDSGERYIGSVLYKTCEEPNENDFRNFLYELFVDYEIKNEKLDKSNLESLVINDFVTDSENDEGGSDYLLSLSVICKDGSNDCFKYDKEFDDYDNIKLYISINKYNEIYNVFSFKNSGVYFEQLNEIYTEKVKNYLLNEGKIVGDNLRDFEVTLVSNNGKDKFRGVTYADSYLINISYLCSDNTNECVVPFDKEDYEGDYANLVFYSSMYLDNEDNVVLVGPRQYLELE